MSEEFYCRLCAMKIENYVNIFGEEGEKLNLASKIIQCLQIWLYPEDVLPKIICTDCCSKVNMFFDFFQTCSQSQISLMSVYKERKEEKINLEYTEINSENNLDHDYEDVGNSNSGEDFTEYTELATPEKVSYDQVAGRKLWNGVAHNDFVKTLREQLAARLHKQKDTELQTNQSTSDISCTTSMGNGDELQPPESAHSESVLCENATSKRKLRTPIRHSISEEPTEDQDQIQQQDAENIVDESSNEKRVRKCKNKPRQSVLDEDYDEDLDYEPLEEDEPKQSTRVLDGYVWKCVTCSQELKNLSELRKHHAETHNQTPVFACTHCNKSYTRYRSFSRHVRMHESPKKFVCNICGKGFSQKTVLQTHATVHTDERPHSCDHCGKTFKQFSSLYLHSKCHLPEQTKPKFTCSHCHKEFATKHTLEIHLKIHTGERNFVCDMCGKRFIAKGSLDYHILTHSDSKPHCCNVCGKGFKTARLLAKHSTVHTGVKPHQCDVCGKQFRERGALREHNRIHTGAMPYSCDYCGKLFRFKGILTVHRRQHTGERPYSCTECRREFTNWANYNKHMKRRHGSSDVSRGGTEGREAQPPAPPQHEVVPPIPPAPTTVMVAPPTHYETADNAYKLADDEVYRVPNYIPSMSYYIPPLQHTILQTRTQ